MVVDATADVKAYLTCTEDGLPEAERPSHCRRCNSKKQPHRHGSFWRQVFTLTIYIRIPVFRFKCSVCCCTMSVLPQFVEVHHTTTVDVKEEVVRATAEGIRLSAVAERSSDYAGGYYAEKTLRRWRQCWEARRQRQEMRL